MVQLPVVWTLLPRKTSGARNPRVPRRSGIRGEGVAMPKSISQPLLSWIKFKTRKLSTQLPERKTENSGAWHLGGWDRLYKVCKKKTINNPKTDECRLKLTAVLSCTSEFDQDWLSWRTSAVNLCIRCETLSSKWTSNESWWMNSLVMHLGPLE